MWNRPSPPPAAKTLPEAPRRPGAAGGRPKAAWQAVGYERRRRVLKFPQPFADYDVGRVLPLANEDSNGSGSLWEGMTEFQLSLWNLAMGLANAAGAGDAAAPWKDRAAGNATESLADKVADPAANPVMVRRRRSGPSTPRKLD